MVQPLPLCCPPFSQAEVGAASWIHCPPGQGTADLPPVQERGRKEGNIGDKQGAEGNEADQIKGQDIIMKGAAQRWDTLP